MKSTAYRRKGVLSKKILSAFGDCSASVVSDVMNKMNAMDAGLRPVTKKNKFCGFALTVQTMVGDNSMSHVAIEEACPGDVLVIDGRGHIDTAIWGYVQTCAALKKGVRAVIINGAVRDVEESFQSQLVIFCKGISVSGPHKGWGGYVNVPIACAGVCVHPGDIVLGDADGVVVVPSYWAEAVLQEARQRVDLEKRWLAQVEKGVSSVEAINLKGQIDHLGVVKKRCAYYED